jgi:hypothetical protein
VVCDPRKSALLKGGNKSDRIDARKQRQQSICTLRQCIAKAHHHRQRSVLPRHQNQRINASAKEQSQQYKHDFERPFATHGALLIVESGHDSASGYGSFVQGLFQDGMPDRHLCHLTDLATGR